jgi:UDPglucose--hexose-1-phosphate uridylyltransferase
LRLGSDPWQVRVVPNLYPAFDRQEVVIHGSRHVRSLAELTRSELSLVAEAWRERANAAGAEGFPYLHAFVNEGQAAGASLPHSHSQLLWLREAPPAVCAEAGSAACTVCALLDAERRAGTRLVAERDGLTALCPQAGRQPYELLVAPDAHDADGFGQRLGDALMLVADLVRALETIEGHVAWNAWLHLGAHWHVEVVPRLSELAGIELGAGIHVLTVAPEDAAAALRPLLP